MLEIKNRITIEMYLALIVFTFLTTGGFLFLYFNITGLILFSKNIGVFSHPFFYLILGFSCFFAFVFLRFTNKKNEVKIL